MATPNTVDESAPWSASLLVGTGMAASVRIPIPGTQGLCIQLDAPGGYRGSSSTLFFVEDPASKFGRQLRLDYGPRPTTVNGQKVQVIDYHWNQKNTHQNFGIADHSPAGRLGGVVHQGAKYFRHGGRLLGVVGAGLDIVSIVQASKPLQRATEVLTGWAGALLGCKVVGAGGAWAGGALGTAYPIVGNALGIAIGGLGGCIVGSIGGYSAGERAARVVYQWAAGTDFSALFPAVAHDAPTAHVPWRP